MEKSKQRIAILAAGDYPTHPEPLRTLREADFVVCCDSAYAGWHPLPGQDFIVIGDGDSLPLAQKSSLGSRWVQVEEQDYNDLHKAMAWATAHFGVQQVHYTLVGATGRREDHTLGNISYLATFADEYPGLEVEMLTDYGRFVCHKGQRTYPAFAGQQVSIFSLTPDVPVTANGLKYPLEGRCIRMWWQATLNEALADTFTLEGGTLIVYTTYEAK